MRDTEFTKVDYDLASLGQKAPTHVSVKDGEIGRYYIRPGPSTTELSASQIQDYIKQRFGA
jgi:hypothetical protein